MRELNLGLGPIILAPILEMPQPEEQHGFRRNHRVEEHLLTANVAIDKTLAANLPQGILSCELGIVVARVEGRSDLDLAMSEHLRETVLAVEVGGRWSDEAASFVRSLARAKAREAPARLLQSVLVARWSALLAHAAMSAFAVSLAGMPVGAQHCNLDGSLPPLGELLADSGAGPPSARPAEAGGRRGTNGQLSCA